MMSDDNSTLNKVLSAFHSVYYSDDIQVRMCWWCVYALFLIYLFIYVAWQVYGPEISKTYTIPGKRPCWSVGIVFICLLAMAIPGMFAL